MASSPRFGQPNLRPPPIRIATPTTSGSRAGVEAAVDLLQRHIRHKGESFWNVPDSMPRSRWERILALSE
jgi:hypothetical protein